jgi:hypothetical protein
VTELPLDELPRHTPWVARLLGVEPLPQYWKTETEVLREWERDRWGPLLSAVRAIEGATLTDAVALVRRLEGESEELPIYDRGRFRMLPAVAAHEQHYETLRDSLLEHIDGAAGIVELGAGFGGKILRLARDPQLAHLRFMAAEYTASGRALLDLLARNEGLDVPVGSCDFRTCRLEGLALPPNCIFFTMYAAMYVPILGDDFPDFLARYRPRAVVHVEPVWEHCDATSLFGLLSRRYLEANDYNRNLLTLLKNSETKGRLQILRESRALEGVNPLMPASVIAWRPLA